MALILKKLDLAGIEAFAGLFKEGGSGCFCASWLAMDSAWAARCKDPLKPNLAITRQNVALGHHIGFLVYEQERLVGWSGASPKAEYLSTEKDRLGARLSAFLSDAWAIGSLAAESDWWV
jgi:hypothetical protein